MGFDPGTLMLIGAATGALQGATGYAAAQSQNRAIRRSQSAASDAAKIQMQQVADAAELEREKRVQESRLIIGRVRAASADAGGLAGLDMQAAMDAARSIGIINRNESMQHQRVQSGLAADLAGLSAGYRSSILDAFSGMLGGFGTGLSIGNSINQAYKS